MRRRRTPVSWAFCRCYSPNLVPLRELVHVAGRRWTVEESFPGRERPGWARRAPGPPLDLLAARPNPHLIQRRHLHWHAALQSLAAGDLADARRRANTELAATTDVGMRSAVNWRLLLIGAAPADVVAAEHARHLLAEPGGMVEVFHTFQLALALAVAGDHEALTPLANQAAADPRPDYAEVLASVAAALGHLVTGRPL